MGYDGQGLGKEGQGILILVVGQQRPKHVGLGFSGQESNISSAQITFVNARWIVKEAILIKEKVAGKWPCRIPLKYACRDLEERKNVMILPSRSSPAIGGPSNQVDKHHYKLKMYGTLCLVFCCCKKMGHNASNCWQFRILSNPSMNYCQYNKWNRHWESKSWRIQQEIHPKN